MEGHISTDSLVLSGHKSPRTRLSREEGHRGWSSLHSCHLVKVSFHRMEMFPR